MTKAVFSTPKPHVVLSPEWPADAQRFVVYVVPEPSLAHEFQSYRAVFVDEFSKAFFTHGFTLDDRQDLELQTEELEQLSAGQAIPESALEGLRANGVDAMIVVDAQLVQSVRRHDSNYFANSCDLTCRVVGVTQRGSLATGSHRREASSAMPDVIAICRTTAGELAAALAEQAAAARALSASG